MILPLTFASACQIKGLKLFAYCEQLLFTASQHQTCGKVAHNLNIFTFTPKASSLQMYIQMDLGGGQ